jgi:hypothetical protein
MPCFCRRTAKVTGRADRTIHFKSARSPAPVHRFVRVCYEMLVLAGIQ